MATDAKKLQPIIIKRVKKGGHAAHGGAWKIAYADFVTAMMAFFLLMWLLGASNADQRKSIADYFKPTSQSLIAIGQLASMAMSRTEADGKVSTTGSNNTLGQVVAFNRRGFKSGWRRRVRLETERLPSSDQTRLVYSLRMGFARFSPSGAASGIEAADVLYNIS